MKFIISIFAFSILVLSNNCNYIQSQKQDAKGATLLSLLQNSDRKFAPESLKSVVYVTRNDLINFQATCVDSFVGLMTASNYYDINYKEKMIAVTSNAPIPAVAKAYSTSKTCSQLGFTGLGADQASAKDNVYYKAYYCDASYSPCSDTIITAKLSGSSVIDAGSDGVKRGSAFDCTPRPNWFCQ